MPHRRRGGCADDRGLPAVRSVVRRHAADRLLDGARHERRGDDRGGLGQHGAAAALAGARRRSRRRPRRIPGARQRAARPRRRPAQRRAAASGAAARAARRGRRGSGAGGPSPARSSEPASSAARVPAQPIAGSSPPTASTRLRRARDGEPVDLAGSQAQRERDLAGLEAEPLAQHECLALGLREAGQACAAPCASRRAARPSAPRRPPPAARSRRRASAIAGRARRLAQPAHAFVARDAQHPGAGLEHRRSAGQRAVHREERRLGRVLGVLAPAEQVPGIAEHGVAVPLVEQLRGAARVTRQRQSCAPPPEAPGTGRAPGSGPGRATAPALVVIATGATTRSVRRRSRRRRHVAGRSAHCCLIRCCRPEPSRRTRVGWIRGGRTAVPLASTSSPTMAPVGPNPAGITNVTTPCSPCDRDRAGCAAGRAGLGHGRDLCPRP